MRSASVLFWPGHQSFWFFINIQLPFRYHSACFMPLLLLAFSLGPAAMS